MEVDADASNGDLSHAIGRIWRRKWYVLAPILVLIALSLAQSARAEKIYATSAQVQQSNPNSFLVYQTQQAAFVDPERNTATQVELARSEAVTSAVEDRLGAALGTVTSVSVSGLGDTDILQISVESTDPQVAAATANAYARAYLERAQTTEVTALRQQADELEALNTANQEKTGELTTRSAELGNEIALLQERIGTPTGATADRQAELNRLQGLQDLADSQRSALVASMQSVTERIDQLRVEANAREQAAGQVVREAPVPSSPISPRPLRDAMLYAAIGVVLGLGLAVGRDALGGRLIDIDHVRESAPDVPVLGSPLKIRQRRWWRWWHRTPAKRSLVVTVGNNGDGPAVEAYRALRTSIEMATKKKKRTLLITSAGEREGKTTTAVNLAGSLAAAGYHVVVVDADLHRPRIPELLGVDGRVGLTSVLLGRQPLSDALLQVPVKAGSLNALCSGPLPPNPSEVLSGAAVGDVLRRLATSFDFVIVDSPPVLAVTDPIAAGRWCDDVILVTRAGKSSASSLKRSLARLQEALMEPLGIVFNGARKTSSGYYPDRNPRTSANDVSDTEWAQLVRRSQSMPATNGQAHPAPVSPNPAPASPNG